MARFILSLALLAATASAFVPATPSAPLVASKCADDKKSVVAASDSSTALAYGYNSYNNGRGGFVEYNDYFGEPVYLSFFIAGRGVQIRPSGIRWLVADNSAHDVFLFCFSPICSFLAI